jgi:hypothetical protein
VTFVVGLLVAALNIVASRAIVLDGMSVGAALIHSARLFARKIVEFVVITLLFTVIGILVSLAFAVVLSPIMFLSVVSSIGAREGFDAFMFISDNFGPLSIAAIAVALLFGMFVSAFTSAVWTVAYRYWVPSEHEVVMEQADSLEMLEDHARLHASPGSASSTKPQ